MFRYNILWNFDPWTGLHFFWNSKEWLATQTCKHHIIYMIYVNKKHNDTYQNQYFSWTYSTSQNQRFQCFTSWNPRSPSITRALPISSHSSSALRQASELRPHVVIKALQKATSKPGKAMGCLTKFPGVWNEHSHVWFTFGLFAIVWRPRRCLGMWRLCIHLTTSIESCGYVVQERITSLCSALATIPRITPTQRFPGVKKTLWHSEVYGEGHE